MRIFRNAATAVLTVALTLPLAGPASPVHAQTNPVVVTGDYRLQSDMEFAGTAFVIAADGVTLDLNGHTITGPSLACPSGCPLVAGVLAQGRTGVTVKNGTIKGFVFGVDLDGSSGNVVKDLIVTNSSLNGISLFNNSDGNQVKSCRVSQSGSFGLIINNGSDGNLVQGCVASGNNNGFFIGGGGGLAPSLNNVLRDNVATANASHGINVNNSDHNVIKGNTASGNQNNGIRLAGGADDNLVQGNTVSGNSANGIRLDDSKNNVVQGNTTSNNGSNGIRLGGASNNNEIRGNTANSNSVDGIRVFFSGAGPQPEGNLIVGNSAAVNTNFDLRDQTAGGTGTAGTRTTYKGNHCVTSSPAGLCANG